MSRSAFGQRLRDRRRTQALTQLGLATLAGYAVSTIRKLESGILRPSQQVAKRLAEVLELPEHERTTFLQLARAVPATELRDDPPITDEPRAQGLGSTPLAGSVTPLVGREGELQAATQTLLIPYVRLLTLTGPGGVGKTRLSLAVADALRPHFPDGVIVVSLADVRDPALVAGAIVRAIGLQPCR